MKITKNMLKQLIKETWRTRRAPEYNEELSPVARKKKRVAKKGRAALAAVLKAHVTVWNPEELEVLSEDPAGIWAGMMIEVVTHWGNVGNRAFGCKHDASSTECKIINKVLTNIRADVEGIGDIRNKSWWIQKNYDAIISTLDYVPASEKPAAIMDTAAWANNSGAGDIGDDDL